jgi:hypothetical protein
MAKLEIKKHTIHAPGAKLPKLVLLLALFLLAKIFAQPAHLRAPKCQH